MEAHDLVKSMCEEIGDTFEFKPYHRMTPLQVEKPLDRDYSVVQPGDCVVAFSQADIYSIKTEIEATTNHRCCVVYGALPSETRALQAELFNDPSSEYKVLVASDAVGLGLNFNIHRIIFHTLYKANRKFGVYRVEPALVKQIAGRAGRRSSMYASGKVLCYAEEDMDYLKWAMDLEIPPLTVAGLFPAVEQLQAFSECMPPKTSYATLLDKFMEVSKVGSRYFLCRYDSVKMVAEYLEPIEMPLADRFKYCMSPVRVTDAMQLRMLYHFAHCHSLGRPVSINLLLPHQPPSDIR